MTATYRADDDGAAAEQARLAHLSGLFDPATLALLGRVGAVPGARCLEVGAGSGSVARALAAMVAPGGSVLATDVDMRFLGADTPGVEIREHDITKDDLAAAEFDVVHARGVLEHISARDDALTRMVAATKPGGVVVVEDVDWLVFEQQELPTAFGELHRQLQTAYVASAGYDPYLGRRLGTWFAGHGLVDVEVEGRAFTMHGGTPTMEWYVLGLERAAPTLVEFGMLDGDLVRDALAEVRDPNCRLLSPLQCTAWGWRP